MARHKWSKNISFSIGQFMMYFDVFSNLIETFLYVNWLCVCYFHILCLIEVFANLNISFYGEKNYDLNTGLVELEFQ